MNDNLQLSRYLPKERSGTLQFSDPVKSSTDTPSKPTTGTLRVSANVPDITPDAAYKAWRRDPTPDNGSVLLKQLEPFIASATRRHVGSVSPVNLGKARGLVIDALDRYDGRSSLATYVDRQLLPMRRWSAKQRVGVKLPQQYAAERKRLQTAESDLEDSLGRLPSRAELADHTGIPLERIAKVTQLHLPAVSERSQPSDEGYSEAGDQGIEQDQELWHKTVYYSLNPMNQFIMERTMGLYGARVMSNRDIARKLKVSPGAVSQRKAKIQQLLSQGG